MMMEDLWTRDAGNINMGDAGNMGDFEKLQVQSVGEADCEYKAIYPRKKFSMNLTTLTSKFSAIN